MVEKSETGLIGEYQIVDTGQFRYFNNFEVITKPETGHAFFGQDAQYQGNQASYTDNDDGTITDNITKLVWQKSFEAMTYQEALMKLETFTLANQTDWRLPTIKEAYSLIMFSGVDASNPDMTQVPSSAIPFVDTQYFDFEYASNGDRVIDSQLMSSTIYKGRTMGGDQTVFGVNLADGRIKGYPLFNRNDNTDAKYTVRFVRGNKAYGQNNLQESDHDTILDLATGLEWQKSDSKIPMNWQSALAWAQQKNKENYLGFSDWRVPNAKELQSILDYSLSPSTSDSAAISPLFKVTEINDEEGNKSYPFYWTSTTHVGFTGGDAAAYISFGRALGFMSPPNSSQTPTLMDVHGAGAQRSDPKSGDAADYPVGRGPQGDVIRIENFVRLVRG